MSRRKCLYAALLLGVAPAAIVGSSVHADGNKVRFPESWASGIMYMIRDVPMRATPAATGLERLAEHREY